MLNISQEKFVAALWDKHSTDGLLATHVELAATNDGDNHLSWVASDCATERLAIYRNTVELNLINALSITYPGVWKLIGNECAHNVARLFLKNHRHFPRSGCLDDWGSQFPEFIKSVRELESLRYLSDYAQYEWTKHLCECAPETENLTLENIKCRLETMPNPRLVLHPSMMLMISAYPLSEIDAVIHNTKLESIQLSHQVSFVMVARHEGVPVTFWLDENQWHFYQKLKNGITLAQMEKDVFKESSQSGIAPNLKGNSALGDKQSTLSDLLFLLFHYGLIVNIV